MASRKRHITKVYGHGKDLSNKNVFSCLLNTVSDDAAVILLELT